MYRRHISLLSLLGLLFCLQLGIREMRSGHSTYVDEPEDEFPVEQVTVLPLDASGAEFFQRLCPYIGSKRAQKGFMVDQTPPALYLLFEGKTRYHKFIFPGLEIVPREKGKKERYDIVQKMLLTETP